MLNENASVMSDDAMAVIANPGLFRTNENLTSHQRSLVRRLDRDRRRNIQQGIIDSISQHGSRAGSEPPASPANTNTSPGLRSNGPAIPFIESRPLVSPVNSNTGQASSPHLSAEFLQALSRDAAKVNLPNTVPESSLNIIDKTSPVNNNDNATYIPVTSPRSNHSHDHHHTAEHTLVPPMFQNPVSVPLKPRSNVGTPSPNNTEFTRVVNPITIERNGSTAPGTHDPMSHSHQTSPDTTNVYRSTTNDYHSTNNHPNVSSSDVGAGGEVGMGNVDGNNIGASSSPRHDEGAPQGKNDEAFQAFMNHDLDSYIKELIQDGATADKNFDIETASRWRKELTLYTMQAQLNAREDHMNCKTTISAVGHLIQVLLGDTVGISLFKGFGDKIQRGVKKGRFDNSVRRFCKTGDATWLKHPMWNGLMTLGSIAMQGVDDDDDDVANTEKKGSKCHRCDGCDKGRSGGRRHERSYSYDSDASISSGRSSRYRSNRHHRSYSYHKRRGRGRGRYGDRHSSRYEPRRRNRHEFYGRDDNHNNNMRTNPQESTGRSLYNRDYYHYSSLRPDDHQYSTETDNSDAAANAKTRRDHTGNNNKFNGNNRTRVTGGVNGSGSGGICDNNPARNYPTYVQTKSSNATNNDVIDRHASKTPTSSSVTDNDMTRISYKLPKPNSKTVTKTQLSSSVKDTVTGKPRSALQGPSDDAITACGMLDKIAPVVSVAADHVEESSKIDEDKKALQQELNDLDDDNGPPALI